MDSPRRREIWLPPLNSHQNYTVSAKAMRYICTENSSSTEKNLTSTLHFNLKVDVQYKNDNLKTLITNEVGEEGFYGLKLPSVSCNMPRIDSDHAKAILKDKVSGMLYSYVQFQLDGLYYSSRDCGTTNEIHSDVSIETEDEFINSLVDFMCQFLIKDTTHSFCMFLYIKKTIRVPEAELDAWISWYIEQKRTVGANEFEAEYLNAISRPRTMNELMDESVYYSNKPTTASKSSVDSLQDIILLDDDDNQKESCCVICLEELLITTKMKRLPCSHVFHEGCIVQWLLSRSYKCPMCRYEIN